MFILLIVMVSTLTACSDKVVDSMRLVAGSVNDMVVAQNELEIPTNLELNLSEYLTHEIDSTITIEEVYQFNDNNNKYFIKFNKNTPDRCFTGYMEVEYHDNKIINVTIY